VALCLLALPACDPTGTSFESRMKDLDETYQRGVTARKSLLGKALAADDKSCRQMYTASGAASESRVSGLHSKEFEAQRTAYFVNGCLGLPQPSAAPQAPAAASVAPSPSSSPNP
jgi:hypothetical protein